ncbi:Chitinase 2, partial [Termitomyces sp. J132]
GTDLAHRLSFYCNDDTIDVLPMAFLYIFRGKGGLPVIDFSNVCGLGSGSTFDGSNLTNCSFLESDIRACQAKGKIVTLSLGGATSQVGFSSDAQAEAFGQLLWDMFLGGKGNIRPLGNVALDGIDLDIEKGTSAHYAAMVNKIRSLAKGASKRYYITAAPQCPFPDEYIGTALNEAFFDAIYVQFYNNYCETSVPSEFNFDTWDKWARTQSPNSDIKVYLGAPGDSSAAGDGYVNIETLSKVATDAQRQYSSFGGVMLWDADAAYTNNRYDRSIKNALTGGTARTQTTTTSKEATTTSKEASTISKVATTAHKTSSTPLPELILPFNDPRKTARVKRPQGFTPFPRDTVPTPTARGRPINSRFFRF